MSGIRNIKKIAKQYKKAEIYFHMDLDGITSAIAMREYLKQYGIQTVKVHMIQYGGLEYAVAKPQEDTLAVLVDFSHGKSFVKIHTDHHDKQIEYKSASNQFRHAKSNAETISQIISTNDVFSNEDVKVISMIDSASFLDEGVSYWDMIKATVKVDNTISSLKNHLNMGMATGKLLLTYKNKPNFLDDIVLNCEPSLLKIYNRVNEIIQNKIAEGEKRWVLPQQIEKNSRDYYERQKMNKMQDGTIESIKTMDNGESLLINNEIIVQLGGGYMGKTGGYDRYTAFRLYPQAKYFIMIWHTIGMVQISKNPWNKEVNENDVNLGEVVINGLFKDIYVPILSKSKYNISLLALKMKYEENITFENENESIGFDAEEINNLFQRDLSEYGKYERKLINRWMKFKPSDFIKKETNTKRQNEEIDRAIKCLNSISIPLSDIILKTSGGHPAITNVSGLSFYSEQQKINTILAKGLNPYEEKYINKKTKYKKNSDEDKEDSPMVLILKSIATQAVKKIISLN